MNFVAGTILATMQFKEEPAFWAMLQLFHRCGLNEVFDTSSLRFRILSFQVEVLMREQLAGLCRVLVDRF